MTKTTGTRQENLTKQSECLLMVDERLLVALEHVVHTAQVLKNRRLRAARVGKRSDVLKGFLQAEESHLVPTEGAVA